MHYPIFYAAKPIYHVYIGKIILILAKKLNIFNKIIYKNEKMGERVNFYPSKLPNALANILFFQIGEIEQLNLHRQTIAKIYNQQINNKPINSPWRDNKINLDNSVCLRYPLLAENPARLSAYAKKHGIILGDWYNQAIAPKDIDLTKTGYLAGECPKAERLASQSINLPTDRQISLKDAIRIIKVINSF